MIHSNKWKEFGLIMLLEFTVVQYDKDHSIR